VRRWFRSFPPIPFPHLTRRTLAGALSLLLLLGAASYLGAQPVIRAIPVVSGTTLLVQGQHFGPSAIGGTVLLQHETGMTATLEIVNWTDTEITARLPLTMTSGAVQITLPARWLVRLPWLHRLPWTCQTTGFIPSTMQKN